VEKARNHQDDVYRFVLGDKVEFFGDKSRAGKYFYDRHKKLEESLAYQEAIRQVIDCRNNLYSLLEKDVRFDELRTRVSRDNLIGAVLLSRFRVN